jgi:hypothetical protein
MRRPPKSGLCNSEWGRCDRGGLGSEAVQFSGRQSSFFKGLRRHFRAACTSLTEQGDSLARHAMRGTDSTEAYRITRPSCGGKPSRACHFRALIEYFQCFAPPFPGGLHGLDDSFARYPRGDGLNRSLPHRSTVLRGRPSRACHFRALIECFQCFAAPFPGDGLEPVITPSAARVSRYSANARMKLLSSSVRKPYEARDPARGRGEARRAGRWTTAPVARTRSERFGDLLMGEVRSEEVDNGLPPLAAFGPAPARSSPRVATLGRGCGSSAIVKLRRRGIG